ncbi:MAG: MBL fold metallo-hydrolase [Clostridia bacterium]|nr:MBL fold metallo-hydrolase [Clostridia bacterium]
MTKTQKKKLITYAVVVIIAIIFMLSEKTGRSNIKEEISDGDNYSYVHFLDVGQGDCTLIESADGQYALIDTSTQSASGKIISYLEKEGVEKLEFILFTHPHEDHIGCGDEIIENFNVGTVYMTEKVEDTTAYRNLLDAITVSKQENNTSVICPEKDDVFKLSDIEFTVLSDGSLFDDLNDSSICLKMELGKSTFIFTGDAETKVERYILEGGENVSAEVYKCAHHGSSTSNSEDFIDAVHPDIAIISCGNDNSYGHPHDEVITSLSERNILYRRTDLDGDIVIAFDDDSIGIL